MPPIDEVRASAFTIPTDRGESDGTLEWDATTIIVVEVTAAGQRGLGYSYAEASAAGLVARMLAPRVVGLAVLAVPTAWVAMVRAVRNVGRAGVASGAIAAVDAALWDLKARLLAVALVDLLGPVRDGVDVYGSGGFTSYNTEELAEQLAGWVESGISRVKMKVGSDPAADEERVATARNAIGPDAELFVDANGAYTPAQALAQAEAFGRLGVSWFEEPVSSDDLDGLRRVRHGAPAGMDVTAAQRPATASTPTARWDEYYRAMVAERRLLLTLTVTHGYGGPAEPSARPQAWALSQAGASEGWRVRGSRLAGGSVALVPRDLDPCALLREAQQPAHGVGVMERLRVGPRQVHVVPVADAERPVVCDALVGAAGGRVAGLEQVGRTSSGGRYHCTGSPLSRNMLGRLDSAIITSSTVTRTERELRRTSMRV